MLNTQLFLLTHCVPQKTATMANMAMSVWHAVHKHHNDVTWSMCYVNCYFNQSCTNSVQSTSLHYISWRHLIFILSSRQFLASDYTYCVCCTYHILTIYRHYVNSQLIKHFPTLILHEYINFNINWFGHTKKYSTFFLPLFCVNYVQSFESWFIK